jgi:hypothetical protein
VRAERLRRGDSPAVAAQYALLITLGKLDEALGVLRCFGDLLLGREAMTLDYKVAVGDVGQDRPRAAA